MRKFPPSERIPKNHRCKNCEYLTVSIKLPPLLSENVSNESIAESMRAVAKATKVDGNFEFFCTYLPTWVEIYQELTHYCGQFILKKNWKGGYQDIERTWEEVDRVYATRWDCLVGPEGVRRAA